VLTSIDTFPRLAKYPEKANREQIIQSMRQVVISFLCPDWWMPWCREKDFDLRLEFHLGLPFLTVWLTHL
jgi:hypothetical protein